MKKEIVIEVSEKSGTVTGFEDEINEIFNQKNYNLIERKRVSRIVPKNKLLRIVFTTIRAIVPENSRIANWTRKWKCKWIVIVGKKEYGEFRDRRNAIEKEKEVVRKKEFGI